MDKRAEPPQAEVVAAMHEAQLLPAIWFIFSRRGCEQAVLSLHAARVSLTSPVRPLNMRQARRRLVSALLILHRTGCGQAVLVLHAARINLTSLVRATAT